MLFRQMAQPGGSNKNLIIPHQKKNRTVESLKHGEKKWQITVLSFLQCYTMNAT